MLTLAQYNRKRINEARNLATAFLGAVSYRDKCKHFMSYKWIMNTRDLRNRLHITMLHQRLEALPIRTNLIIKPNYVRLWVYFTDKLPKQYNITFRRK